MRFAKRKLPLRPVPKTNYEAIIGMSPRRLASFLDEVWCIGCNDGCHMASLPADGKDSFEESIIFDVDWMNAPVDPAILSQWKRVGRKLMLEATVNSISKNIGVDLHEVAAQEDCKAKAAQQTTNSNFHENI